MNPLIPAERQGSARRGVVTALVCLLCLHLAGCAGGGAVAPGVLEPTPLTHYIEEQLIDQLPPEDDSVELLTDMKLERRGYGVRIRESTQRAMAPLLLAASLFVVEGPVDLLLTVVPGHKLGKLFAKGKEAIHLARSKRLTQKHLDEFAKLLQRDRRSAAFLQRAVQLGKKQQRALRRIHQRTRSEAVVRRLLKQHVDHDADLVWIAGRLQQAEKRLGRGEGAVLVRRFTFGNDLLEDITVYSANPSWAALQQVVENKPLAAKTRASLASKVTGLLGERAAYERLQRGGLIRKYIKRDGAVFTAIDRGVPYRKGSVDIVAYTDKNELVVAEVKNWGLGTWQDPRSLRKLFAQLKRHNEGLSQIRRGGDAVVSNVSAKVLFVAEDGYKAWGDRGQREAFEKAVNHRGWTIELIPSETIWTFGDLIDVIR